MSRLVFLILIWTATVVWSDGSGISIPVQKFANHLYKELSKDEGNVVFSPYSVHSALSVLALGATKGTLKKLLAGLSFSSLDSLKNSYSAITKAQSNTVASNFLIANGLFLDKQYVLKEGFRTDASGIFKASPQYIDVLTPTEAAGVINKWVANATNQTIPQIIDSSSITEATTLLIVNAIYFKGQWTNQFNKSKTIEDFTFHTSKGDVKCNMMSTTERFQFLIEQGAFQLLQMSFQDSNIKIAFIKPDPAISSLKKLEDILNAKTFFEKLKALISGLANVMIPKLKITCDYELNVPLSVMNFSDIFGKPSFGNLLNIPRRIAVANVNHKVVVDIDEEGVTAAAATIVRVTANRSPFQKPREFKFDSPFLFYVYDKETEIIYIQGRVENPVAT